jgi:hypothetical protein
MSPTRRLAASLAADVAGYSRLVGADEESASCLFVAVRHRPQKCGNSSDFELPSSHTIRNNALPTAPHG